MADLTQEQFNGLDQRRSVDDLNTLLNILRRDGSVTADVPEQVYASDEDQEAAEAALDESINNSVLIASQQGPPPVTEAEAANTAEQAEAEAEWNENQALVPPVPIQEVGSSDAGPETYPGTHAKLDELAEERGHSWSDESLSVADKQEELKGAKQGS